jgi:hemoglobin
MKSSTMGTIEATPAYEHRAAEVGITAADIRQLIPAFYTKVRRDSILGPVFDSVIDDNWAAHIETVCSFWFYVTRLDRHYNAQNFMSAHLRQPTIRAELLPRWLALFRDTACELCAPAQADALIDIARRMADTLELSLNKRYARSDAVSARGFSG